MRLNIKDKPEKTDVYGIRLRISLKARLIQLRTEADEVGMDFPATIDDLMESVADELATRIKERKHAVNKTNPQAVNETLTEQPPILFTNGEATKAE